MVVKTFMDMDQDSEEEKELYLNLALHLASDFFLKHPDKDVRLLVACCLADIFRIYAPEAPYTSPDKLKVTLLKTLLGQITTKHCKMTLPELLAVFNYITLLHLLWSIHFHSHLLIDLVFFYFPTSLEVGLKSVQHSHRRLDTAHTFLI